MTYCNPRQYCDQFGLNEATMLLQDEEQTLEQHMLNAVVRNDPVLLEPLNTPELAVAQAALARLTDALSQASRFMDGYLRSAVTLPLTEDQIKLTTLKSCCAELTRCILMDDSDNATELAEKRCETQRKWLREVNAKIVKLFPDDDAFSVDSNETRHGIGKTSTNWTGYGYP